jgi:hypothetical protein
MVLEAGHAEPARASGDRVLLPHPENVSEIEQSTFDPFGIRFWIGNIFFPS